jgi:hypothetical protein
VGEEIAAAIASIKVRKLFGQGKDGKGQIGTITEVKLWNKGEALDRLMKHFRGLQARKREEARRAGRSAIRNAALTGWKSVCVGSWN